MTATAADERSLLPGPTWPASAPPPASFSLAERRPVVLADDPCDAGFSGADPEYAGMYLHARYFDPKLGTFLSPDPIGVAGGMNAYGYGGGDPVNRMDRSGLSWKYECVEIKREINGDPEKITVCDWVETPDTDEEEDRDRRGPREPRDPKTCKPGDPNCRETCRPGDPNCNEPACKPGDPGCDKPPTSEPDPVNWWAEYLAALPGAVVDEFGDDGCATVFFRGMRDSLLPFTLSATSFSEAAAYSWGAATAREAVGRAVTLRGAGAPMRDPIYAGLRRAAGARAASGPVIALVAAVGTGLYEEGKAMASGQCR